MCTHTAHIVLLEGDFMFCLFCIVPRRIMATLAEVNASLSALSTSVDAVAAEVATLKAGQGAATAADLDVVKAAVDAAQAKLAGL